MGAHDHGSHVPDEPKTPMWLPALGALFFLLAGIWFATRPAEVVADPAANAAPPPPATAVSAMVPAGQGAPRPFAPSV